MTKASILIFISLHMLKLFKILEIFLTKYSKTSTQHLIDHYLRIKIILNLSLPSV